MPPSIKAVIHHLRMPACIHDRGMMLPASDKYPVLKQEHTASDDPSSTVDERKQFNCF